jgi:hypothetical protein
MVRKFLVLFFSMVGCSTGDPYNANNFYKDEQQRVLLTNIITYILDAPPATQPKDRFKPEHNAYYNNLKDRFSLEKLYVDANGKHYFYLLRPTTNPGEQRGTGGMFTVDDNLNISEFRELFVTPSLPTNDAKEKSSFLFDKLVKGELNDYLTMRSYVQWPNEISYYDTVTYQWKLKEEMAN